MPKSIRLMDPVMVDRLQAIDPKRSPANSPNLKRWVARHGRGDDQVYELVTAPNETSIYARGQLFIGSPYAVFEGDTDFSGVLLMGVLCQGAAAKRACLRGLAPSLKLVEGFWERYARVGRCAVDPMHQIKFIREERYLQCEGLKVCLWCQATLSKGTAVRVQQ